MNGLEFNKIAAAILVAGLLAMVSGTFAKIFYSPHVDPEKRGYKVDVAEAGSSGAAKQNEVIDLGLLLANADPEAGKKLSKKCTSCHSFEKNGVNKTGPNLWGIVGKQIASSNSFAYSKACAEMKGDKWDYQNLYEFIGNPRGYMKGTKMAYAGIKSPEKRADLLAWLNTMSSKPVNFPAPAEPTPDSLEEIAPQAGGLSSDEVQNTLGDTTEEAEDSITDKLENSLEGVFKDAVFKDAPAPNVEAPQ